jgi:hypothetical protein
LAGIWPTAAGQSGENGSRMTNRSHFFRRS